METELNELLLSLFPLISPMKLIKNNKHTEYSQKLTQYYTYLPPATQEQVCRQIDSFKCDSCRTNLASQEFTCGHKQCSQCFSPGHYLETCPCSKGKLKKFDQKNHSDQLNCIKCGKVFNGSELNCIHFCMNCAKDLPNSGVNKCRSCASDFKFSSVGRCSQCGKNQVKVLSCCELHGHCVDCVENDLLYMSCLECGRDVDGEKAAFIVEAVRPKCGNCGNRFRNGVIWNMACCGNNFCYFCLGASDKCFCGQGNEYFENFRSYTNYGNILLQSFRKIENTK